MANVEMYLDDSELTKSLGLPDTKKSKLENPFYQATQFEQEGKYKEAERIYIELMNVDFDNPVLLASLGMNYAMNQKNGLAFSLLNRALEKKETIIDGFIKLGIVPKNNTPEVMQTFVTQKEAELYNALGTCWKHENHPQEAREYFEKAQSLIPPNADIQNNLATLYINEGHPEKAFEYLNEALRIESTHAQARWNMSLAYLEMGDYEHGWELYDWGMNAKVRIAREYTKDPLPVWNGEKGKRIVVYGEQGIGDEILFASCLPELIRDSELVVFDCHKKIHRLFCNSFPGIDIYPTREDEILTWPMKQDGTYRYNFDYKVAIGSLPRYYRPNLESFPGTPYIHPTKQNEQYWAEKLAALGTKPKIGISWVGGHKRTRVEVRSMQLEQMLPILQCDADFISLQYTPVDAEIDAFTQKHGIKIHHWPEACYSDNYDVTAGLVANLDLVITVCTSLVHLAGSMGVPVWVMTPSRPAWRYRLDLDYLPWYQNSVLFRQQSDSVDWTPVVEEVKESLQSLLEAK